MTETCDRTYNVQILDFLSIQIRRRSMMVAEVTVELEGSTEYPALYKVMMDKLNEQRQLDQFTDITLIVDGEQDALSWCPGEIHV